MDSFPIHHIRKSNTPLIAIGQEPKKQLVIEKLQHPNNIKKALYYQELLENGQVQSQHELAKLARISQTKVYLTLKLLRLDEEIKDFILNLDDADPRLEFLAVYRLQPLFRLKDEDDQKERFWNLLKTQYSN